MSDAKSGAGAAGRAAEKPTADQSEADHAAMEDAAAEARAQKLEEALRADGVRITRQRGALIQVLSESDDHPDAVELHRRAQEIDQAVSLATVYRTLATLEEQGVVHRHAFDGAPARFETADAPHHDHIIELETGRVVEFSSPEIEELQKKIADQLGYEVVFHKLELYCRRKKPEDPSDG